MLKISLFGSPQISHDRHLLTPDVTGRTLALFTYLVLNDGPHERSLLVDLLWSDVSEAQAKTNLRYVLYDLRKILGDYLVITRQTIAFDRNAVSWVDAYVLTLFMATEAATELTPTKPTTTEPHTIEPQLVQDVLQLYRGELLAGFYIHNAPNFEVWLEKQRRHFHNQVTQTWLRLCQQALNSHEYDLGILAGRQLLALDPGCEEAHHLLMQLFVCTGQRTAALAQFSRCQEALDAEYGVAPDAAITDLFYQIQSGDISTFDGPHMDRSVDGRVDRRVDTSIQTSQPLADRNVIKRQNINWEAIPQCRHFVGRREELSQLRRWIGQDRYQLVGLFGLAGQGKSALTAALVSQLSETGVEETGVDESCPAFEQILWYSVTTFSSLLALLQSWCQQLDLTDEPRDYSSSSNIIVEPAEPVQLGDLRGDVPTSLEACLQILLPQLRNQRVLLVLDDIDSIFGSHDIGSQGVGYQDIPRRGVENEPVTDKKISSETVGYYLSPWQGLDEILRRIAETEHSSCLIVHSSIVPPTWRSLAQQSSSVRHLTLTGLERDDVNKLLNGSGLQLAAEQLDEISTASACNPKLLTQQIALAREFGTDLVFTGLSAKSLTEEVYKLLYPFFQRLTETEKDILLQMIDVIPNVGTHRQTVQSLWQALDGQMAIATYLQALDSLQRYHLLEIYGTTKTLKLSMLTRQFLEYFLIRSISKEITLLLQNHRHSYMQQPNNESPAPLRSQGAVTDFPTNFLDKMHPYVAAQGLPNYPRQVFAA